MVNMNIIYQFQFSYTIFYKSTYETGVAHRVRRDAPPYGPPAPAYAPAPVHHGPKGRVGPVYTFVKTDPQVIRAGLRQKM